MKITVLYALMLGAVNLAYGLLFLNDGVFSWEGRNFSFDLGLELFFLYFVAFFFFIVTIFLLHAASGLLVGSSSKRNPAVRNHLGAGHWSILWSLVTISTIASVFINHAYGLNIAGKPNSEDTSNTIKLMTVVLNPDYVCAFFLSLRFFDFRKYLVLSILVVISFMLRGWMGGLLIVAFCWIINYRRYPRSWPAATRSIILLIASLVVIGLPLINFAKHEVRNAGGLKEEFIADAVYFVLDNDLLQLYSDVAYTVTARFQSIDTYALFMANLPRLSSDYLNGQVLPFFMDNMLAAAMFSGSGLPPLGQYIAGVYLGEDVLWATHPGYIGWVAVAGVPFIIYSVILVFTSFLMTRFLSPSGLPALIAVFTIIFLWHGWISAYVNVLLYLLYFISLVRMVSSINVRR